MGGTPHPTSKKVLPALGVVLFFLVGIAGNPVVTGPVADPPGGPDEGVREAYDWVATDDPSRTGYDPLYSPSDGDGVSMAPLADPTSTMAETLRDPMYLPTDENSTLTRTLTACEATLPSDTTTDTSL